MSGLQLDHRVLERFRFALIDAMEREALPVHWPTTIIAPRFLGEDTGRCPVLVDLSRVPLRERGDWCDTVRAKMSQLEDLPVNLLIAAECDVLALAEHLARRMVIKRPGQARPMQWRFFDPGTFLQLPNVIGDVGMAWLLGPISAVWVPWAGCGNALSKPQLEHESSFRLLDDHFKSFLRIGVVNRVALQCPLPADGPSWVNHCQQIDRLVQLGQQMGLSQQADLVTFALHGTKYHPHIHSHPRMQAMLAQLRLATPEDELDYRELSSRLDPSDWAVMTQELKTQQSKEGSLL